MDKRLLSASVASKVSDFGERVQYVLGDRERKLRITRVRFMLTLQRELTGRVDSWLHFPVLGFALVFGQRALDLLWF